MSCKSGIYIYVTVCTSGAVAHTQALHIDTFWEIIVQIFIITNEGLFTPRKGSGKDCVI